MRPGNRIDGSGRAAISHGPRRKRQHAYAAFLFSLEY
jgi:hypothetical protein